MDSGWYRVFGRTCYLTPGCSGYQLGLCFSAEFRRPLCTLLAVYAQASQIEPTHGYVTCNRNLWDGNNVRCCPFYWNAPDLTDWLLMLAMGALGTLSHYLIIKAFEWGEMPMLAPFTYAEIVSASLFGLIVFGQFPDLWAWIGITIVIVSGIYISQREFKRN